MKFPSDEFDDATAALCHGAATDQQAAELYSLLAADLKARDEYLWQVELHARLASMNGLATHGKPEFPIAVSDMSRTKSRRLRRAVWLLTWTVVTSCVSIAAYVTVMGHFPAIGPTATDESKAVTAGASSADQVSIDPTDSPRGRGPSLSLGGIIPANVRFAWAWDSPVIVGTGRLETLPLGAYVPYEQYGHTLHVWDWSKSDTSRVFSDVRLFEGHRYAVSPDGTLLVSSQGEVVRLENGERSKIDLGDEFFSNQGDSLRRIQELLFTPDGGRLAILVTNIESRPSTHPLRRYDVAFDEEFQLLAFPSGRLLSKFPAGSGSTMRIAFSAQGDRVVSATPADALRQQVVERRTDTGEIVRAYEPYVEGHAYALALAPDGEMLAVFDGVGALLLWDTRTGELVHRVDAVRHESFSTALRFSPDSRYIAVNAVTKSWVVDAQTGKIAATIPQSGAADFHWSDDGARLTIVTGLAHYGGNMLPTFNHFPAVFEWNWRQMLLLKSHDTNPPAAAAEDRASQPK